MVSRRSCNLSLIEYKDTFSVWELKDGCFHYVLRFYVSRSNTAQKWSFLLWISSVNVTKSAVSCKVSFPLSSLLFFFEYLLRQGQIEKIDSFLEITFTVFLSSSKCSSKVPIHSQNSHESMVRRRYSLALEKKTPLVSVY